MLIINKETKGYQTNHIETIPDGWLEVPIRLESRVREYHPYYELVIEDGVLVDVTPTERPLEPESEPTEMEKIRADIDFLAVMTGVEL